MEKPVPCFDCKHLRNNEVGTCKAYPKGIPVAIWSGENTHRERFPGDNGVIYAPKPGRRP